MTFPQLFVLLGAFALAVRHLARLWVFRFVDEVDHRIERHRAALDGEPS